MIQKALLIAYVWPEPWSSAAGVRDLDLIEIFEALGWEIVVASHAKANDAMAMLARRNIRTIEVELNRTSFDEWLASESFDVVVFDRFITEEQFGARVASSSPNSLRIVDTQDLHSLRRAREARIKRGGSIEESLAEGERLGGVDFLRELAAIFRSDLTLVLSDFELDLLRNHYSIPKNLIAHFPFAYSIPNEWKEPADPEYDFAFLGNFRHPPNYDALFWLAREIWPRIRSGCSGATLRVMGAYPPREVMALADAKNGIIVDGPVENAQEELSRCRVNLAPLRFGAGIKGKICDAWLAGRPTVTTGIGAEGMRLGEEFGGLVANCDALFSEAALRLQQSPELAEKLVETGRRTLVTKFSRPNQISYFRDLLRSGLDQLELNRLRNPVGALLAQEERRAQDYFSRWIELKETR